MFQISYRQFTIYIFHEKQYVSNKGNIVTKKVFVSTNSNSNAMYLMIQERFLKAYILKNHDLVIILLNAVYMRILQKK